jgi:hypothetical protein
MDGELTPRSPTVPNNEPSSNPPGKTQKKRLSRKKIIGIGVGAVIVSLLVPYTGVQVLFVLAFGWPAYLGRVLPRITLNWEMIACGVAALVLGTWMLDRFLRWAWRSWRPAESTVTWKPASTIGGVALVLLLFANATALTGIFHQVGWLFGKHTPLFYDSSSAIESAASQQARGLWLGLVNYANDHDGKFPDELSQLIPEYFDQPTIFQYRVDRSQLGSPHETRRFAYVRGLTDKSSPTAIVLYTPVPVRRNAIVVQIDGSSRRIPVEELDAELWETEKALLKQ